MFAVLLSAKAQYPWKCNDLVGKGAPSLVVINYLHNGSCLDDKQCRNFCRPTLSKNRVAKEPLIDYYYYRVNYLIVFT